MFRVGEDARKHIEDGKGMGWWVRLYFDYTSFVMGSPVRTGWPRGLAPDEQPALLVAMFYEVEAGILKELQQEDGKQRH